MPRFSPVMRNRALEIAPTKRVATVAITDKRLISRIQTEAAIQGKKTTTGMAASLILLGIRFTAPWVIRALIFTLRACFIAVISLWIGVRRACEINANRWADEAARSGFPTLYIGWLYWIVYVVTAMVIFFYWIILALVTNLILSVIF